MLSVYGGYTWGILKKGDYMTLKARPPEDVKPTKPKMLISGESGVGKTFFALDFPMPYLFDTEGGATREQYQQKLKNAKGVYFGKEEGSQDFRTVIEETKQLCTTAHPYKTAIYDSFTYLYMLEAAIAEADKGSDFGRDKKMANIPTRQLIAALEKLDMNVILICHSKDKWERKTTSGKETLINVGSTFDGYDKLEYILDLWIEILKGGKTFLVRKSRVASFIQGNSYPLSYDKFAELYGKEIIEKQSVPTVLASIDEVARLNTLVEGLKVDNDTIKKWLDKCGVEVFEDMSKEQIGSLISFCEKKLEALSSKKQEIKPDKKGK